VHHHQRRQARRPHLAHQLEGAPAGLVELAVGAVLRLEGLEQGLGLHQPAALAVDLLVLVDVQVQRQGGALLLRQSVQATQDASTEHGHLLELGLRPIILFLFPARRRDGGGPEKERNHDTEGVTLTGEGTP
jgi:hypothetical protein